MSDRNNAVPGLFTILNQVVDGLATRLQIASIELSVAKNNAAKTAIYAVLAALFGLFALVFISVALLVIFWEDHRIFVSCCIAGVYLLLFLFFLGKARNLAANMPYAFEESRQILAADVAAFRASRQGMAPTSRSILPKGRTTMQANEDVARKLAQLTVKAGEQRAQIQDELTYMRSKPASAVKNIGVDAVKTMQALGLTNPKVAIPLARTVFIPAAVAIARLVLKNGSPRRYLGAALIAASSFGIFKGIEYDEKHPIVRKDPKNPSSK